MIKSLLGKYINGAAASDEKAELARLVAATDDQTLSELLKDIWNNLNESENPLNKEEADVILQKILNNKPAGIVKRKIFKRSWIRVAAAAVFLLMFTGTYFLLIKKDNNLEFAQNIVNDLQPGGNKAILTLADGSKVVLDNAANGKISNQGNTSLIKLNNQIQYKAGGNTEETIYNIIETPRGGMFQLKLADGTKVWLNSSSSLRYPINFTAKDKERRVEMTGEVFFEVAPNKKVPFIVNIAGKGEVKVLGTHFNINAYPDEPSINTTLIAGSVKVTGLNNSQIIVPGQQAQINQSGKITLNNNPDIEAIMAWKNGSFVFNSLDIKSVMRQISRWYDVDVYYSGNVSDETYSGIVSRNSNVSALLKIMEEGGVKFRIEGRKITVIQ